MGKRIPTYLTTVITILIIITIFFNYLHASGHDSKVNKWAVLKTLHFDVYYPGDMTDLALYTAKIAENSYVYLANNLKHELTITTAIVIHPLQGNFYYNSKCSEYGIGYNFDKIDLSYKGSYGLLHKELTHKLVHIFQNNIFFNRPSGWTIPYDNGIYHPDLILESMAEYFSAGYNEYTDMIMRDIMDSDKYIYLFDIKSLNKRSGELQVIAGISFFYFLESVYGRDIIAELVSNIRDCDNLSEAVKMTTKTGFKDLNKKWIDFYKNKKSTDKGGDTGDYASSPDKTILKNYNVTGGYKMITAFIKSNVRAETVKLVNTGSGKIIDEIPLPFIKVMDPDVSADCKLLVFIGVSYNSAGVYMYDIDRKIIIPAGNDLFTKRFPKISSDKSFIVFSSNENTEKDFEAKKYKIIKYDLRSKIKTIIADNNSDNTQPDISPDMKKVAYISNSTGIYNVYCYDINSRKSNQLTDVPGGAFFPVWLPDGKSIAYSDFQDLRFDTQSIDCREILKDKNRVFPEYKIIKYPASYFDQKDSVLSDYNSLGEVNVFSGATGVVWKEGFAGSMEIEMNDFLGSHKLDLRSGYLRNHKDNFFNFNLDYLYSKYIPDFGAGAFYEINPLRLPYAGNCVQTLNYYPNKIDSKHYGFRGNIKYPLAEYSRIELEGTWADYENGNSLNGTGHKSDIHSDRVSLLLAYNSLIRDKARLYRGMKGELSFSRDFEIVKNDSSFNSINFDFLKLFPVYKIFVFSIKGSAGKIFGEDSGLFKYYIGGFNSVRGHRLFQYKGENAFLLSAEIRLIFIDKFIITWPAVLKFNDISMVLFADTGSAWDNDYKFRNSEGEFEDFKAGAGAGIRFMLADHIVFRLDVAWPYYCKSFGKNEIISGFEVKY